MKLFSRKKIVREAIAISKEYWCSTYIFYIQEFIESLILAQDERWRYALHMQVERKFLTLVADGWVTRENLPLGGE